MDGFFYSPEKPIHSSRPYNADSAFFLPAAPLESNAEYEVIFRAERNGKPIELRWTFTTGNRTKPTAVWN